MIHDVTHFARRFGNWIGFLHYDHIWILNSSYFQTDISSIAFILQRTLIPQNWKENTATTPNPVLHHIVLDQKAHPDDCLRLCLWNKFVSFWRNSWRSESCRCLQYGCVRPGAHSRSLQVLWDLLWTQIVPSFAWCRKRSESIVETTWKTLSHLRNLENSSGAT